MFVLSCLLIKTGGVQTGVNTTGRKSGVFEHPEHQSIGATAQTETDCRKSDVILYVITLNTK